MNGSIIRSPEDEIKRILAELRRNKLTSISELNEILLRLRQNFIRIPEETAKSYKEKFFNIIWFQAYAARNVEMLEGE